MDNSTFVFSNDLLASKGQRLINYLIDIMATVALFVIIMIVAGVIGSFFGMSMEWLSTMSDTGYNLLFITMYLVYLIAFESYGGRSIGKLITGTMVVNENGDKPDFAHILGRTVSRLIPFDNFSFLGETGWHDKISGTRVVKKTLFLERRNMVLEFDEIGKNSELI